MKSEPESALAGMMKPMKREDVTDLIVFRRMKKGLKWSAVAKKVGESKEWVTAACLGQMQMTKKQAETVGRLFDLPEEAVMLLQVVPCKRSLPTPRATACRSSSAENSCPTRHISEPRATRHGAAIRHFHFVRLAAGGVSRADQIMDLL